jgi:hypothetical protein
VQLITADQRNALLRTCVYEAVHLELRDAYAISGEAERFRRFIATDRYDDTADDSDRREWLDLIRSITGAGRFVRRARVVSEPPSDYIRYEWAGTGRNIGAGEQVRWLPRRLASTLALPGNDFWLFDRTTVVFIVFTGNGEVAERQLTKDRAAVELCGSAFEAVWSAAIPHGMYKPH